MLWKITKYSLLLNVLFIPNNHLLSKYDNDIVQSRQEEISQLYLKQFPEKIITAQDSTAMMKEEQKNTFAYLFKIQKIDRKTFNIDKIAHGIVTNQVSKEANETFSPKTAAEKLNLFSARPDNNSLLNELTKHSPSLLGKNALLYELTNPTTCVDALLAKQKIIKTVQTENALKDLLVKTAYLEQSILNLWHQEPILPQYVYDGTFFGGPISRTFNLDWLFKPLNKYSMLLELKAPGFDTVIGLGIASLSLTGLITVGPELMNTYFADAITDKEKINALLKMSYIERTKGVFKSLAELSTIAITQGPSLVKEAGIQIFGQYKKMLQTQPALAFFITAYFTVIGSGLCVLPMIAQTYNTENWFAYIQKYFIDLASYLEHTRSIVRFFNEHNLNYPLAFTEFEHLTDFDNKAKHSADFNQLIDLLKTKTFKGNPSKLSYLGRVKCAYKLFMNVRQEFEPILYAMAKLQMYNGIAKLMTSSAKKQNSFCFAEFVDYGPYVEAIDFWNPMVGQETAVSNSLLMTPAEKDIILHGPNTGGKTTTIKGLMYNIILAQTFGIGAARKLILSPFTQINCFMDIQDDVSQGSSLFDAEVRFATELYNSIQTLKKNEYAFTIADEILRSTSPSKGQACAYQFTKKLAKDPNSMSITVTHYPKLVELATENPNNGFRTFHVEIKRDINGKVIRTYKLKLGSTDENIAGDILQEHGVFDETDLLEVERLEEEFAAATT